MTVKLVSPKPQADQETLGPLPHGTLTPGQ